MRDDGNILSMKCCNCGKEGIVDRSKPKFPHPLEGWLDFTFYIFPEMPTAKLCCLKCATEYLKLKLNMA